MSAFELVVAASTPHLSDALRTRIVDLAEAVDDWPRLIELAAACRAAPALFDRLAACGVDHPLRHRLEKLHLANVARNAGMARQLGIVMQALDQAGIEALSFKGPVLAQQAYDTPALRQFDDIDIMVRKEALAQAKAVIEGVGYIAILGLPASIERSPFRPPKPYTLRHRDGSHDIDLAADLLHDYFSFRFPRRLLWETPHTLSLDGQPVRTLPLEILFLYLCVHGSKHLWSRPAWTADVAGLLFKQADAIDWDLVWELARKGDAVRMLQVGVRLAVARYEVLPPEALAARLAPDRVVEEVIGQITRRQQERAGEPEIDDLERLRIHLRLRKRLRSRLRYLMVRGITPSYNDWRAVALPTALFPLYYPIRVIRLMLRLGRRSPFSIRRA